MTLRVRIARDNCSPLWVARCALPCAITGGGAGACKGQPQGCWIVSRFDEAELRAVVERRGYEVAE